MPANTLAQKRSAFALEQVLKIQVEIRDKFAKLVAGLPAMILQNGFGQTLAFLLAKGSKDQKPLNGDKHIVAFDIMVHWLCDQNILSEESGKKRSKTIQELSKIPQDMYLRAQGEAMQLLEWVKRYANSGLFID